MQDILSREPISGERIFPFVGGEELNSQASLQPNAYVIYLSDLRDEADLLRYPLLENLVRRRVKPERDLLGDNPNNTPLKKRWWAYQAHRPELYEKLKHRRRALAHAEVSAHLAFQFVPSGWVYNKTMVVIDLDTFAAFAVLQSRVHESWVRFTASTLEDRLRYSASDCFATFPLPNDSTCKDQLERAGQEYYEFRKTLMIRNNEGLTKIYNRFHDRYGDEEDMEMLRGLHGTMDRAVLDAYGWTDLRPISEFILDYEESAEEMEPGKSNRRKEPWRYRWTGEFRDEVLARLLELNRQRAQEERAAALASASQSNEAATSKKPHKKGDQDTLDMFSEETPK